MQSGVIQLQPADVFADLLSTIADGLQSDFVDFTPRWKQTVPTFTLEENSKCHNSWEDAMNQGKRCLISLDCDHRRRCSVWVDKKELESAFAIYLLTEPDFSKSFSNSPHDLASFDLANDFLASLCPKSKSQVLGVGGGPPIQRKVDGASTKAPKEEGERVAKYMSTLGRIPAK